MDGISQPVDEYLHLPGDMIDIDRRAEHDSMGGNHPLIEEREIISMHTRSSLRTAPACGAGFDPERGQVDQLGLCPRSRGTGKDPLQEHAGPALRLPGTATDAEDKEILS